MASPHPLPLELMRTLIRANHILHKHGAVDAFGHVSVRDPSNPEHYVMSAYMAPALVSSPSDLVTYRVADSEPANPGAPKGYSERFIHSEMYKRYSGVNCVIHSHAPSVLPFAVVGGDERNGGTRLRPVFHMAAFLGQHGAPVWDIEMEYRSSEVPDMLVRTSHLGASLANAFSYSPKASQHMPDDTVVVMRHHGFTTHGPDIETAIYRTIYTIANASAQLAAQTLNGGSSAPSFYLKGKVAEDTRAMNEHTQDKAWPLLIREVEVDPLYQLNI